MLDDDDEGWPPEGGCIGTGHIGELTATRPRKLVKKNPIGFVYFPDKPEIKHRPKDRPKAKRPRKR